MVYGKSKLQNICKKLNNKDNIATTILEFFDLIEVEKDTNLIKNNLPEDFRKNIRSILSNLSQKHDVLSKKSFNIPNAFYFENILCISWETLTKSSTLLDLSEDCIIKALDVIGCTNDIDDKLTIYVNFPVSCVLDLLNYIESNISKELLETLYNTKSLWFSTHFSYYCNYNQEYLHCFKYLFPHCFFQKDKLKQVIDQTPNFLKQRLFLFGYDEIPLLFRLVLADKILNLNPSFDICTSNFNNKLFKLGILRYMNKKEYWNGDFDNPTKRLQKELKKAIYSFLKLPQFKFAKEDYLLIFKYSSYQCSNLAHFIITADPELLHPIFSLPSKTLPTYVQDWLLFNSKVVKRHPKFIAKILSNRLKVKDFPVYSPHAENKSDLVFVTEDVIKYLSGKSLVSLINHIISVPERFNLDQQTGEKMLKKALPFAVGNSEIVRNLQQFRLLLNSNIIGNKLVYPKVAKLFQSYIFGLLEWNSFQKDKNIKKFCNILASADEEILQCLIWTILQQALGNQDRNLDLERQNPKWHEFLVKAVSSIDME